MKRGIIAGVVAIVLLLTGCQNNTSNTPTDSTDFDDPIQFAAEKNAQNKYIMVNVTNFQEADGFFLGTNSEHYLHYYDKANGISGVLCADPSCAHDSNACGANIGSGASLSYYDGKLYWVGSEGSELRKEYLWQSDLSGMNRKKIMEIPWEDVVMPYQPQRYVIHQGKLYIMGSADVVDGTQTGKRKSLLSRSLSGEEGFTTVYDEVFPSGVWETYRFVGGAVYISVVTSDDNTSFDLEVMKVDIKKNTMDVIYQETNMSEHLGDVWVTEDQDVYLSGSTDKEAYLWRLENNTKTEITSWSADKISTPDVMDGIVLCLSYDDDIRWADIRDFSGKTIYSGKLFPDVIPELDHNPNAIPSASGWDNIYSIGLIGGDAEKLIFVLSGEEGPKLDRKLVSYVILLDLKDNMNATILWSSEE